MHFCDNFLVNVTGKSKWKSILLQKRLSEVATASDEAFTLVVLENNWAFWMDVVYERPDGRGEGEVDGRTIKRSTLPVLPKWTASPHKYCKKLEGWAGEAIDRYNELFDLVEADRLQNGLVFDMNYRQHLRTNNYRTVEKLERATASPRPSKRARVVLPPRKQGAPPIIVEYDPTIAGINSTLSGESYVNKENDTSTQPFVGV